MKTATWIAVGCAVGMAMAPLACAAEATAITLPKDTLVTLRFTDPISTRSAVLGQQVHLRVANDVYLGTDLVIHADEPTVATITDVEKPRSWGRSGKLEIEFSTVKAFDGSDVRLGPWAQEKKAGMKTAAGATIGGIVVLGPVGALGGMFVKGKQVDIPVGQEIVAAVRWDTPLAMPASSIAALPHNAGAAGAVVPDSISAPLPASEPAAAQAIDADSTPLPVAPALVQITDGEAVVQAPAVPAVKPALPPAKSTTKPAAPVKPATPAKSAVPAAPKKAAVAPATPIPGALQEPSATVAPVIPFIEEP
ncbi:MAG: hypothetical protein IT209_03410 [Armatimonadetes bacterium]|nr:hypothetical protein [Armatimonadota bacterium]